MQLQLTRFNQKELHTLIFIYKQKQVIYDSKNDWGLVSIVSNILAKSHLLKISKIGGNFFVGKDPSFTPKIYAKLLLIYSSNDEW